MSDSQRRLVCRLGFFMFCLLPTIVVAWWIVAPANRSGWVKALAQTTGLSVQVERFSQPRARMHVMHGLQLIDPERGRMTWIEDAQISHTDQGMVVMVSHAEIPCHQLPHLLNRLHDRLLRGSPLDQPKIFLRFRRLTLKADDSASRRSSQTLEEVRCRLEQRANGTAASIRFYLAGSPQTESILCTIQRSAPDDQEPVTYWSLDTSGTPVPCTLLAALLPPLGALGQECMLTGRITGHLSAHGWQGELSGSLTDLDLYECVNARFPHILRGNASLKLTRCRVVDGRLMDAAGTLVCQGGGSIGKTLIDGAVEHLGMRAAAELSSSPIPFQHLAIGFQLDDQFLEVRGVHPDRSVIRGANGYPLLDESDQPRVPVLALVRLLVPPSQVQVPMTKETAGLLQIFPVPSVRRPRHLQDQPPRSPLRLLDP